jgi:hypothetical protein
MLKITLSPLDSEAAQVIAKRRGIPISDLVSNLIQREAAIEITNWRASPQSDAPTPVTAAQPLEVRS